MSNLWGEEFVVPSTADTAKKVLKKIKEPKAVEKSVKLNKLPLEAQLNTIKEHVNETLSVYKDNVRVIKSVEELHQFIDKAIANKVIALDTETDHSLDPLTATLMGACLYTPGDKAVYVPVNHWDYKTQIRWEWQCTEEDIKRELDRLKPAGVKVIYHNADFDYRVIYCTCNCALTIDWDTMVGARILNENERASLKGQYASKIDPSVEKYSVDTFFKDVNYRDVDVDSFALYAATDAYVTYKLYMWQLEEFAKPENEGLMELMERVEIPIIPVVAKMELTGIKIDKKYAKTLSDMYHKRLIDADKVIEEEVAKLQPIIDKWRMTPEAQYKPPKKTGNGEGKSKSDQLKDPVEVTSPTQLAILLYDVLKFPPVSKKAPRGTGEDEIVALSKKHDFPLGNAILVKRGLEKLLGTYVDKIPAETHADDRIRASINPLGADTGRFAVSRPSLQNIPSANKEVRLMFEAAKEERVIVSDIDTFDLYEEEEVLTVDGWVLCKNLKVGDVCVLDEGNYSIKNIIEGLNRHLILSF